MRDGGRLRIQTHAKDACVVIEVEDDGAGMDPATREHVFEPFFTTKAAGAGSGLGLYVVHTIVTDLGGRVAVESEPGAGTRVSVGLPALEAAAVDRAARPRPRALRGHERVLLVEDRPEARELMRSVLAGAGYEVVLAADGVEALSLAERTPPFALLVTDVAMPRIGGRELARTLLARQPRLRILFVSGHPHDLGDLAEVAPGARLLRKPFALDALLLAAREVLDAR
jgi:CheY-like chemotaxis protein